MLYTQVIILYPQFIILFPQSNYIIFRCNGNFIIHMEKILHEIDSLINHLYIEMKKFIKLHVKIFIYVKFLHDICRIQIYIKTKFIYVYVHIGK
jgi:hypothetical protein